MMVIQPESLCLYDCSSLAPNFLTLRSNSFSPLTLCRLPASDTLSSADGIDSDNSHILTCLQQSPLYSNDGKLVREVTITPITRTGRAIGSFIVESDI